jgi:ubiquinone/menaquinone biosynthesis C-methylase UbiE
MREVEMRSIIRKGWSHPDRVDGWVRSQLHCEFTQSACRKAWLTALARAVSLKRSGTPIALTPAWVRADVSETNAGRGGCRPAIRELPPLPGLASARLDPPPRRGEGNRPRALDIGTGPGTIAQLWAELGYATTGLDFSPAMLEAARKAAAQKGLSITFIEGDADSPPFAKNSFDVVSSRFVLFTLPHPGLAIRRWMDLLRPGGLLVSIGHDHPTVPGKHHQDGKRGKRKWKMPERYRDALGQLPFKDHTSGELSVALEAAGLRDIRRIPMDKVIAARKTMNAGLPDQPPYEHTPFILVGRK